MPYSGPASAYGVVGRAMGAVFKKVNDEGGINGRKINFISYDDAYSPPKAVEQARKLIESDEVLSAVRHARHPLQHRDPEIRQQQEGAATVRRHRRHQVERPEGVSLDDGLAAELPVGVLHLREVSHEGEALTTKIAVLYQNDDMGKDYLKGLKDGFAKDTSRIVAEESYEVSEPTIDLHVVRIKSSNPDVVVFFTTPKFGAQAIKKLGEIELGAAHHHLQCQRIHRDRDAARGAGEFARRDLGRLRQGCQRIPSGRAMPALRRSTPCWPNICPMSIASISSAMTGYNMATTMVEVLKRCGDNLTHENVMKQAASLKQFPQGGLLPGVTISTGPEVFSRSSNCS